MWSDYKWLLYFLADLFWVSGMVIAAVLLLYWLMGWMGVT